MSPSVCEATWPLESSSRLPWQPPSPDFVACLLGQCCVVASIWCVCLSLRIYLVILKEVVLTCCNLYGCFLASFLQEWCARCAHCHLQSSAAAKRPRHPWVEKSEVSLLLFSVHGWAKMMMGPPFLPSAEIGLGAQPSATVGYGVRLYKG